VDIPQACLTIGNVLPPFQSSGAGKAAPWKENIKEGRPEFCSEDIAHFIQNIYTSIDKYLTLQYAVSFI
jgi:hypothetical protein